MTRLGGFKVWWRERRDADAERGSDEIESSELEDGGDRYLCSKCYFQGPESLPKGYEDVKTVSEMRTRKKELGH